MNIGSGKVKIQHPGGEFELDLVEASVAIDEIAMRHKDEDGWVWLSDWQTWLEKEVGVQLGRGQAMELHRQVVEEMHRQKKDFFDKLTSLQPSPA